MAQKKEIGDFGEKIGGAKKELYKKGLTFEDVSELNHRELLKACVKKNVWEKPNYEEMVEEGVPKEVVYFYKLAYDGFPTKINTMGNFELDIEKAKNYIELANGLRSIDIKSYDDIGKLKDIMITEGYLAPYGNGRRYQHTKKSSGIDLSRIFKKIHDSQSDYERRKANAKIEDINFPYKQQAHQKGVVVRENRVREMNEVGWKMEYSVHKKYNGYYRTLETFDTREKAEQYINTTVKEEYELNKRGKPGVVESRVQLKHIRRKGIDFRRGKDVNTDIFQETFKLRGGEFGNWNNQDDRQQNLNLAYDSLIDLSKILKISPQAVALDQTLSLAFGSRGRGGVNSASAHYEPSSVVINLTKMRGAGSLAHEWGHALDDYLGRKSGNVPMNELLSENLNVRNSNISKEVEIIKNIMDKIKHKVLSSEEIIQKNKDMLFHEKEKFRDNKIWRVARSSGIENKAEFFKKYDYFLNPQNNSETYEKHLERFLNEIPNEMRVILNGRSLKLDIEDFKHKEVNVDNNKGLVGSVKADTQYFKNAKALDKNRSKTYFSNNEELFARAFETYIESKLKEQGLESNYLVYGTDESNILYPPNNERDSIFKEFDKLFEAITVLDKSNIVNEDFEISDIKYENKDYKNEKIKEEKIKEKSNKDKPIDKQTQVETENKEREGYYRYYLTQRPPSIGTHPMGAKEIVPFDTKTEIDGIEAWGYVEYSQPLSESQIDDYELTDKSNLEIEEQENIQEGNSNIDVDEMEKMIEQEIEQDKINKDNLVEALGESDSFRLELNLGQYKKVALVIPNMSDSEEKHKVVFGSDRGEGVDVLSHNRLNTIELADRLVEEGFTSACIEEKLNIADLQIVNKEGNEIDTKGLMDYKDLSKKGDISVIRLNNSELENLAKLTVDYSLLKDKDSNKLIVLKVDRTTALEEIGKRDRQLGGIPYSEMKLNKGRQYIEVSNIEYEKIKNSNVVHSAFGKGKDKINLVIPNIEAKEQALITIGRNHEKTLGNVKYEQLKVGNKEVSYKQLDIKKAIKTIEKMIQNGLEVNVKPKGDKIYLAFKKEDTNKVQAIIKSMNSKDKDR